jgi:hypothetical protein
MLGNYSKRRTVRPDRGTRLTSKNGWLTAIAICHDPSAISHDGEARRQ